MRRSARTRSGFAAVAMAIPLALASCGGSSTTTTDQVTTTAAPVNAGKTVLLKAPGSTFTFEPADVTVKVGDTLTWKNEGGTKHTVTAVPGQTVDFKSDTMLVDATFVRTFDKAGTINYYCSIHGADIMKGTITVAA